MIALVACILLVNAHPADSYEVNTTSNNTGVLVETLRRQLMQNNYDYLPSSISEELPLLRHHEDMATDNRLNYDYHERNHSNSHEDYAFNLEDHDVSNDSNLLHVQDAKPEYGLFEPRAKNDYTNVVTSYNMAHENNHGINDQILGKQTTLLPISTVSNYLKDKTRDKNDHGISKNDLLFYLDDDKIAVMQSAQERTSPDATTDWTDTTKTMNSTVKYKIITLKHPSRRSSAVRRFLQEERSDGVVLAPLDGGPLPPFRLPRARRQYMRRAPRPARGLH